MPNLLFSDAFYLHVADGASKLRWLRYDIEEVEFLTECGFDRKLVGQVRSASMIPEVGAVVAAQVRAIAAFHVSVLAIEVLIRAYHSP